MSCRDESNAGRKSLLVANRCARLMGLLLTAIVYAFGCDDGMLHPINATSSHVGGSAQGGIGAVGGTGVFSAGGGTAAWSIGGNTGFANASGGTAGDCVGTYWAGAALEDQMLAELNTLRTEGVACAGGVGYVAPPLLTSESLRCAARVHSMTGFQVDSLSTPAFEVILIPAPPATLDVPTIAQQLVFRGGDDCELLLSPEFPVVGIGFASDGVWGYWTFYLAYS